MEPIQLRKEVRLVLREFMNVSSNKFPYKSEDDIVSLPEDIDTQQEYLVGWDEASTNKDIQSFPYEEFKKGISVEQSKRRVNILDIAEIVINNLKENPRFYSNLGVK
ncbi:MAG: hypothetical protein AABY15_05605 [Nanoarchaeota archaeon]